MDETDDAPPKRKSLINALFEYAPANIVVFLLFFALVRKRRPALVLSAWLTLIIVIGPALKRGFNSVGLGSQRPGCDSRSHKDAAACAGMPSCHALFAGFLAAYVNAKGGQWKGAAKKNKKMRTLVTAIALVLAGQRVVAKRHTLPQVLVGLGMGAGLGWGASKF